jgi:hypothetical protein
MKKLIAHTTQDLLLLNHLKNLLEQEEIPCLLEQVQLQGAMGELPLNAWPKLLVLDESLYQRARNFVHEALENSSQPKGLWLCNHCGEHNETQFTACWRCGSQR